MTRALVTGITGQDGTYLANFLLKKEYEVYGTFRRVSTPNFWRLQALNIFDKVCLIPADLLDMSSMLEAIKISNPEEIYNLGAQSFVGASFVQPIGTGEITGLGVLRMLEAIRQTNIDAKFYQASSSEMFGDNRKEIQSEDNPFCPQSPYAAAKLYGHWMTRTYRDAYDLFACNGILFNHESPLRGLEFVTRKISNGVAKIKLGLEKVLKLGNLEAKRDWGYAPEYVESMWLMLQQDEPDDYVIATNETHDIREFVELAFDIVNLDWKEHVVIDSRFFRPLDVPCLQGNYKKAEKKLGWRPTVKFKELVKIMVNSDLEKWRMWLNGERFPWDAPNYPDEISIMTQTKRM